MPWWTIDVDTPLLLGSVVYADWFAYAPPRYRARRALYQYESSKSMSWASHASGAHR